MAPKCRGHTRKKNQTGSRKEKFVGGRKSDSLCFECYSYPLYPYKQLTQRRTVYELGVVSLDNLKNIWIVSLFIFFLYHKQCCHICAATNFNYCISEGWTSWFFKICICCWFKLVPPDERHLRQNKIREQLCHEYSKSFIYTQFYLH